MNDTGKTSALAGPEPTFYFDFSSPFAYLAATRIDGVLRRRPRWAPISMAFVTSAHERLPWSMRAETKERGKRECEERAVAEAAGLDPDHVLAEVRRPAIKEKLKLETERAIRAGVFGVPTVLLDEEIFWGDDRLSEVAQALGGRSTSA